MNPLEQAEQIVAQGTYSPLDFTRETWKRINPKFSMIARTFINLLRNETVLSRLGHAQTIDDLKALLVVDEYLARAKQLEHRRQIQELLANPQVPLDLIEVYAALTYLQEALLVDDEIPRAEQIEHELDRVVYTAEAAARQLGWNTEELYEAIARDDIRAELCIRLGSSCASGGKRMPSDMRAVAMQRLMTPVLSLRHNGANPAIVETSLPNWALGRSNWRERVVRLSLWSAEVALKSVGVVGVLVLSTFVAVIAVCLSLIGVNMLIGYDFSENVFSFLWSYRSQGWSYYSDGRIIAGYFGLLLGAIILWLSPYVLWGFPMASAVGIFHWLDRPFRRCRMREGIWAVPLADDPVSLGELKIEFSNRLPLGSPRLRSWIAKTARASAIALTVAAYFLLIIVLKDLILAVPWVIWFFLLIFGFSFVAMGALGLVAGFVLNCIVPVLLAHRLLDGERPAQALQQAFRSAFGSRR